MPPTKTSNRPAAVKRASKPTQRTAAPAKRTTKRPTDDGPKMSPDHERVNRIVLILKAAQGCEQQEVAEAIGLDPSALTKCLKGVRSWKLEDLTGMAEFFDVEPAIWFGDPDQIAINKVKSVQREQ